MKEFIIAGKHGFIRIELNEVYGFPNETSYLGGYDVKGKIKNHIFKASFQDLI
ncbi:hypothetical protein [Bacillus sp. 165]|uniref:hypothetical protein n=1 Tax=Bacillus sp. 165 TaxID=1529117 RepID=UPI001ADCEAE4|nr:hypothetical protein [Bacillus sp. 165]MBO9131060.1 hypothetical protein [Bacillus sp. 165]